MQKINMKQYHFSLSTWKSKNYLQKMQFSNFLSSGLSNFLFSICIQAATLTVCSPYLEARVTSPNFGMMLFKQNGQFFVVICLGTLKKYVLNEYFSKHLCKKGFEHFIESEVLSELEAIPRCRNQKYVWISGL